MSKAIAIDSKIVSSEVVKPDEIKVSNEQTLKGEIVQMHEKLIRPEKLIGSTYKIKTPMLEHALYVTINDVILNEGSENEVRRPFEVFVNCKSMEHFQWVVALTLVISAVFRKGGDVTFLVEELHSVFDPKGGYFKGGGKYKPSLVFEIGDVIEEHLKEIGLLKNEVLDERQQELIDDKLAKLKTDSETSADTSYPANATLCAKCNTKAVIRDGGCSTCASCGNSSCQ